jgi:hypothetical protein
LLRLLLLTAVVALLVHSGIKRHRHEGGTDWRRIGILVLTALAIGGLAATLLHAFGSIELHSWRGALLSICLCTAGFAAIGALVDALLEFGIGHFPNTYILPLATGFGFGMACLGVLAVVLEDSTGFQFERTFTLAVGLFLVACTMLKPSWYWGDDRAEWLRARLGDAGAAFVYYALGLALIAVAFFVPDLRSRLTH